MLPEIQTLTMVITVKNVGGLEINWSKIMDSIRETTGYKLHEISTYTGCTHTRVQKLSTGESCRLSNCEKIAILDLYQDSFHFSDVVDILETT